jgi:hypothetical protein
MRASLRSRMRIYFSLILLLAIVGAFAVNLPLRGNASFAANRNEGTQTTCNGRNGISRKHGVYTFSQLHVASNGTIQDTMNCVVRLHGANWAGTDYKDAIGGNGGPSLSTFQWFHSNEHINIWRIWVNPSWWLSNYPVPLENNMSYQSWIQQIVSWVNQSGAYVLLTKGAQWPGVWDNNKNAYDGVGPCGGSSGITCGHQNTAVANCQENSSLCWQRATGLTVGYTDKTGLVCTQNNASSCDTLPTSLSFWQSASALFASNSGVFFGAWNEMHQIYCDNWKVDNESLISTIRAGAPNSLVFFGNNNDQVNLGCLLGNPNHQPPGGLQNDFSQPNLVYDFHVYPGSVGNCPGTLEPTSAMWTQYPTYDNQVLAFTSSGINPYGPTGYGGHGISFSEWGGSDKYPCNIKSNSYDVRITGFIKNKNGFIMYYDQTNLATFKHGVLTATSTGITVAADYKGW